MFFLILLYPILGGFTMVLSGNNGVNVDAEMKFIAGQNVRVTLKDCLFMSSLFCSPFENRKNDLIFKLH